MITITWLEVDSNGLDEACKILQDRIAKIITHNPALAGKLVKSMENQYFIQYPSGLVVDSVVDEVFQLFSSKESTIHEGIDLVEQANLCKNSPFVLTRNQEFDRPSWLVSVVPSTQSPNRFAVVVSLSHVFYDGASHYLHNMLMGKETIRSLISERDAFEKGLDQQVQRKTDKAALAIYFGGMVGAFGNALATEKENRQCFGYYMVDPNKIQKIKDAYQKDRTESQPEFISTNDIISSCFLKGATCEHGFIAVDKRHKIEGRTKDHLGAYQTIIPYRCPQDVVSPALIRQSLPTFERVVSCTEPFEFGNLLKSKFSVVTNWASFCSGNEPDIPGCRQLIHFPLSMDVPLSLFITCIIFEPQQGQLACLFVSGDPALLDAAKASASPFDALFMLEKFLE